VKLTFEIDRIVSFKLGRPPERVLSFDQDYIRIGTLPSSHIVLPADSGASRMHAVIEVTQQAVVRSADAPHGQAFVDFIDVGSVEGSIVNGKPTRKCALHDGDIITLGRTRILVRFE